jgi:hypothetical protein
MTLPRINLAADHKMVIEEPTARLLSVPRQTRFDFMESDVM